MDKERDVERVTTEVNTQGIEESQRKILVTSQSAVLPFRDSHFFDKSTLEKEQETLKLHIQSVNKETFGQNPTLSPRDTARWIRLQENLVDSLDFTRTVEDELDQVELTPGNYTYGKLLRIHEISLAIDLFQQATIKDLVLLSKKYSFEDKYVPLALLMEFSSAAPLSIRVGSIALQDFMNVNKNTNPVPYYQYLVEAHFDTEEQRDKIFQENQDYPKNLYPNGTKQAIVVMQNRLPAIYKPTASFAGVESPTLKEGAKLFSRLAKGVQDIQNKTYQSVLDPTTEDFLDLSELVGQYLGNQDKRIRILALHQMSLDTKQRIIEAYRKARKYEREDNNGEFYMIFGDSIGEYIEEASPTINVLTDEDIVTILNADKEQSDGEKSEPTFEQLGKRVSDILNRTSNRDFDINPSDIDWSQLHVSQDAQIYFDANRPRKFTVKIAFDNELGESTEVECAFDTVKNIMDWNHPEDPMSLPENSDLIVFRGSLLVVAQSILNNVYAQAQAEYQLKLQSRDTSSQTGVQRPKRERSRDPVYQLRKDTRALQREESFNQGSLFEVLTQKEEVKNRVILPEGEEYEDLTAFLSHVDREIVRRSIEEYNEKGTGAKFRRKKRSGSEGEPIYGLSIGCTVPKGARVLLRETESEAGTRNFGIVDIRYRKDIYSKNRL